MSDSISLFNSAGVESFDVSGYYLPLMEYAVTPSLLTRPRSLAGVALRLLGPVIAATELTAKADQLLARSCRIISPGGVALQITAPE